MKTAAAGYQEMIFTYLYGILSQAFKLVTPRKVPCHRVLRAKQLGNAARLCRPGRRQKSVLFEASTGVGAWLRFQRVLLGCSQQLVDHWIISSI